MEDLRVTRLELYCSSNANSESTRPHIFSSKKGMEVQRLMRLFESIPGLMVPVQWRALPPSGNTGETLLKIYEEVPALVNYLFFCKNTPSNLFSKARLALQLFSSERRLYRPLLVSVNYIYMISIQFGNLD